MSLRSKRLARPLSPDAAAFLDSTREDAALVRDDILGTLAHLAALEKGKVLTKAEAQKLRAALAELYAGADGFSLRPDLEDVHMNVESWLTAKVGDLGKKVHTGRSRNDQVALDLRLWARRMLLSLAHESHHLAEALLQQAEEHPDAVMPGHTHFQPAQPVLLSHHLGAHATRLARDIDRIRDAWKRTNVSPLGAAALAGTAQPVDPVGTAKLLGFDEAFTNSLDAVSDRDFLHELLFCASLVLNHLSGLSEEMILFTHPVFGFATLDDAHATGSSLMPQKKNPDVFEVARAKAATVLGALAASLATTKGLPLAYNRDLQEAKRLAIDTVPHAIQAVRVAAQAVYALTFHPEPMGKLAGVGYTDATELADYLVGRGVAFRDAHALAAEAVQAAIGRGVALDQLPLDDLKTISDAIGPEVFEHLGPGATVRAKTSPGGTSGTSSRAAGQVVAKALQDHERWLNMRLEGLARVEAGLVHSAPRRKVPA